MSCGFYTNAPLLVTLMASIYVYIFQMKNRGNYIHSTVGTKYCLAHKYSL